MDDTKLIHELNKKYNRGDLIPFVGAGFSMPFDVPDWGGLIRNCAIEFGISNVGGNDFMPMINFDLDRYDYWSAIDNIKKYLNRTEDDIQEYIRTKILEAVSLTQDKIDNNFIDLEQEKISLIFTTNYDHLISKFVKSAFQAINLADLSENIQNLLSNTGSTRIFHLHGNISQPSSIVISSDKYKELYKKDNYIKLMELFGGVKTFLFLGFSFSDVYIQQVIKENKGYFKSKHYIIMANPKPDVIVKLKKEYNIETISYDPSKSSHIEEIRKILHMVFCINTEHVEDIVSKQDVLLEPLPTKEDKKNLEKNVFCKKLRIEDINEVRIDASKEFYFMAEQYFRWLKKSGIKEVEKVADYILRQVYLKYQDEILEALKEKKSPDELWMKVHDELKSLELTKLNDRINTENMPNQYYKQGFVHVLADSVDSAQEVWWGDKRFE